MNIYYILFYINIYYFLESKRMKGKLRFNLLSDDDLLSFIR